jgi:hypothetical protein
MDQTPKVRVLRRKLAPGRSEVVLEGGTLDGLVVKSTEAALDHVQAHGFPFMAGPNGHPRWSDDGSGYRFVGRVDAVGRWVLEWRASVPIYLG